MTYDTADRLTSSTDARGQVLAFDYDTLDRKTAEHTGSATGPVVASWVYDTVAKGQPTSSTRIDSGNSYVKAVTGYDAAYRPTGTSVTVPAAEGGLAGTYVSTSTYNVDGGVKTQKLPTIPGLPSETVGFDYDGLGQPIHFFGAGSYVSATTYSPYGQPLRYQMGNTAGHKVYETFAFDEGTRRLASTKIDREGVATSDSTISYGYDPAGNVTSATDVAAGLPTDTQCFGYDYLRRLTEAWTPSGGCGAAPSVGALGGPAPYWQSFGYDLTGNRTSLTTHAAAGDTVSAGSYPAAGAAHPHFLTTRASTGPGGTSSDTYTPDAIGNTATRTLAGAGQTLAWDAEGHLGAVNGPGGVTGFLYDAEGGRLIRRDPTATTLYLGDAEVRLDKATGALSSTRYYSYGGAALGVRTAAGLQLQIADPHNTATLAINDATGALTRRRMDPFGQQRDAVPPSWAGERGFVGGTIDPSLGLTHLGAREYDPALGRFLSVDPIMDPADPQQLNGYSYANNTPATMSDPDGLIPLGAGDSGMTPTQLYQHGGYYNVDPTRATPPTASRHAAALNAAHDRQKRAKAKLIKVAKALVKIAADVLGITDGIDCLVKGDLAACGEAALTIAATFVGGLVAKIVLKYAIRWAKAAKLGKALWRLAKEAVAAVKDILKGRKEVKAAEALADDGAGALGDAARAGCHSFAAGTGVVLADGSRKSIEKVKVGDRVRTTDPANGRQVIGTVTVLHLNHDTDLTDVTVRGKAGRLATVHTTAHHRFWDDTRHGWAEAATLTAGDRLHSQDGSLATVTRVRTFTRAQSMYDLTIEDVHTYYILAGTTAILVHNNNSTCGVGGLSSLSQADNFGIWSYRTLRADLKGTGLEAHHLIEQRLGDVMGQSTRDMASIAVTNTEHQAFTNAWRRAIPYGEGTANATRAQVDGAARQVYAGYPDILAALGLG